MATRIGSPLSIIMQQMIPPIAITVLIDRSIFPEIRIKVIPRAGIKRYALDRKMFIMFEPLRNTLLYS
jgi:hypothetical protein